jgi:hypothetical protein
MLSPLSVDKKTVKKFKIPEGIELHPRQKLAFLESQLHELKQMQWRARVDIIHATRLTESDNDVLKHKGHNNMAQHINEVEQATGAIVMIQKLIDELKEESPDLDGQASGSPAE